MCCAASLSVFIQPTASWKYQIYWDLLWIHNIYNTNWKFLLYCMYATQHLCYTAHTSAQKNPCKKYDSTSQKDSGSSYHIKFSIPESKLCCYEIMTEHSYPLRLYAQCQLLQQKENRAVFYVDDDFLPSVLCKPVSGMGVFLSCHSSVTLLWRQLDWIQTCKDFSSVGRICLGSHWRTPRSLSFVWHII